MIINYLKVTLRNFQHNKLYALLNTFGLALGFAAFILIAIYLHYETSYENFHSKANRIYRPTYHFTSGPDFDVHWARVPVDYINQLPNEIPEIKTLIRFQNQERKYIRVGEEKFRPDHAYVTDKNVFDVFDFHLLEGNPENALAKPYSVVITQSVAKKYFGNYDPMGKDIFIVSDWSAEETRYVVTGVMEDLPSQTHLPVEVLFSMKDESERTGWAYVYTLLEENASVDQVEAKMGAFIKKFEDPKNDGKIEFEFQAMPNIHQQSNLAREIVPNGNYLYVKIFLFVGLFILLIVLLNFINLSSAMAIGRAKEVGVRSVLGAGKKQVFLYSLTEAIFYNVLAVAIGGITAYLIYPYFQDITESHFLFDRVWFSLSMVGIAIICGLISGIYPAFILTSFNALEIIKSGKSLRLNSNRGSFNVKRVMVAVQFCVSILLIASAFVAYQQFHFLNEKNLGIEKQQVIAIPNVPDKVTEGFKTFKDQLQLKPGILGVSGCMEVPSREIRDSGPILVEGQTSNPDDAPIMDVQIIDPDFTDLMGIEFLAGQDSTSNSLYKPIPELIQQEDIEHYLHDKHRTYLINETAMKQLGWTSPEMALGQNISWSIGNLKLSYGPITGVVKDFNQETLKNKIDPLVMVFEPIWIRTFLIKVETGNIQETIASIQQSWNELYPAYPMEYHFLDELYEQLYKNERVQLQLLYAFSGLAIFVAFLGLFGLIAFSLKTRIKEIAIRRVLGADLTALIQLIGKEYLLVLIIGGAVAIPLSYYGVNYWLQNFAYHIDISLFSYVLTLSLVSLLLLVTVSLQTLKTTASNPADTLRDD